VTEHPLMKTGVLDDLIEEYNRAKAKHGESTFDGANANDLMRLAALVEEVGEVAELLTYDKSEHFHSAGDWQALLRRELTQVANVAVTWASIL
jgi:hypothetical protein